MCYQHWRCSAHRRQEDTLWATGDSNYAWMHCCPGESKTHLTDFWQLLVIQGSSGCKAPSRARMQHHQVYMEVLRQLHSPQLHYQNNCLPYPTVRFGNQWGVRDGTILLALQRPNGVSPTRRRPGQPGKACLSRSWCHQMDVHRYAVWTHTRACNVHQFYPQRQQPMASSSTITRHGHWWRYKHQNNYQWHLQLGKVSRHGLVVHGMPTAGLSILLTFIELAEKPHLPEAFRICWYWCLFGW